MRELIGLGRAFGFGWRFAHHASPFQKAKHARLFDTQVLQVAFDILKTLIQAFVKTVKTRIHVVKALIYAQKALIYAQKALIYAGLPLLGGAHAFFETPQARINIVGHSVKLACDIHQTSQTESQHRDYERAQLQPVHCVPCFLLSWRDSFAV